MNEGKQPIKNPLHNMYENMDQALDITPETAMFTIWQDDMNGHKGKYEALLEELYDPSSNKTELPSYGESRTWTRDGALKIFVTYGVLPEDEDEDDEDDHYEDF